ncbi:MAG: M28 family peptidase [Armatimonadetes bacterium]|nr:M28 family peptidase [Armatimonadota bacterium]
MAELQIRDRLAQVDRERLRADLFHLAKDPLPFRKVNYTIPGHDRSTLAETDDYLVGRLTAYGYQVTREAVAVQAFRCDQSKPKQQWYAPPLPDDPWYTAENLYVERHGGSHPDEIILLCAHKDSQSWVDSPGAYDNAVGTVALLEIARLLAHYQPQRTIRWLWCNEEHRPWTSVTAAERASERGDNLIAVFNTDSLGGRPLADHAAGRHTNVTLYTVEEGRWLAELCSEVNSAYELGLEQSILQRSTPGDDDGSFVKAGYGSSVANLGSMPYRHDYYHDERDVPEGVDLVNVQKSTQLVLAAVLRVDRDGAPASR